MVVALSEEIWYRTYRTTLSTMDLTARLLRYVDNRLCLSDPSWDYENLLRQFPSPGVLRSPHHFGNGAGPGVLGLLHRVRALCPSLQPSARLQPGHGAILRITSCRPTFGFCFTTLSGRQMCAPYTRTNARFCRIAPFVQSCRFSPSPI